MTFLELCKLLRQEAGISGDIPSAVDGQTGIAKKLVDWISRAYEEVQTVREDWSFLWKQAEVSLSQGERGFNPFDFFADFNRLEKHGLLAIDESGQPYPIGFVNWVEFRNRADTIAQQGGLPKQFSVKPNGEIAFDTPLANDMLFTIEYYRTPFVMVDNNDKPIFPAQFHKILLYKALMYYAADEEAGNIFQDAAQNYQVWLDRLEALTTQQPFTNTVPLA